MARRSWRELRVPWSWVEPRLRRALEGTAARGAELSLRPPGFRLRHRVDALGTRLDVTADVVIERLHLAPGSVRLTVRADAVTLAPVGRPLAPLKAILESGAIDFRRIGALVAAAPERPEAVVDARADRVELELMRVPRLASDARLGWWLATVTPWMTVGGVRVVDDALHLRIDPLPHGLRGVLRSAAPDHR